MSGLSCGTRSAQAQFPDSMRVLSSWTRGWTRPCSLHWQAYLTTGAPGKSQEVFAFFIWVLMLHIQHVFSQPLSKYPFVSRIHHNKLNKLPVPSLHRKLTIHTFWIMKLRAHSLASGPSIKTNKSHPDTQVSQAVLLRPVSFPIILSFLSKTLTATKEAGVEEKSPPPPPTLKGTRLFPSCDSSFI